MYLVKKLSFWDLGGWIWQTEMYLWDIILCSVAIMWPRQSETVVRCPKHRINLCSNLVFTRSYNRWNLHIPACCGLAHTPHPPLAPTRPAQPMQLLSTINHHCDDTHSVSSPEVENGWSRSSLVTISVRPGGSNLIQFIFLVLILIWMLMLMLKKFTSSPLLTKASRSSLLLLLSADHEKW